MQIAVLTDVHANLPALQAALEVIRQAGCARIVHTGDAIAIGPHPAECLALLLEAGADCIMGNHDDWFVHGLPQPQPEWMSDGEVMHQQWTHAQLDPALQTTVGGWPFVQVEEIDGVRIVFTHYGLADGSSTFMPLLRPPTAGALDAMFAAYEADLVFYGHDHAASDLAGQARYVNPGSLGCHHEAVARFVIVTTRPGETYTIDYQAAPYDDTPLYRAFEQRAVPEREFIYRAFFGGRFA
ncbi:MAG: metallophosphoesterase family protein [Anaerolineae bacterium]|nr:metallophosphoesterase family protein [Anaerolineae bacterium]